MWGAPWSCLLLTCGCFGVLEMRNRRPQTGFTLIELIVVMVLVGVLAVFVAPRINTADFSARGFHDETLAFLRYAQKTAIAQRRTVCVAFTATTATLTIDAAAGTTTCPGGAMTGPRGETPATVPSLPPAKMAGITYSIFPVAGFFFNGLGQPSAGQTIQVANGGVAIAQAITVEAETGYVHD